MDRHTEFLGELRKRKSTSNQFGYGMTTADQYVKQMLDCIGPGCLDIEGDPTEILRKAAKYASWCQPDMVCEERFTSDSATLTKQLALPEELALPANTMMVMQHVLTTSKEDRDGDILRTKGAIVDERMPLIWQHMPPMMLGKRVYTVQHDDDMLKLLTVLLDLNALTSDAAKLVEADALRFSHGFRVLSYKERKQEGDMPVGFEITKFEIMEASLVSIPSNTDACVEMYSRRKFDSDAVKRYAKSLFDARTKQAPGVTLEEPKQLPKRSMLKPSGVKGYGFDVTKEEREASTLEYEWVARFCGCAVKQLHVIGTMANGLWKGTFLAELDATVAEYDVHDTRRLDYNGNELPPLHEVVELNSREKQTFLTSGLRFYSGDGMKFAIKYEDGWSGQVITVYCSNEHSAFASKLLDDTWTRSAANHRMKGEAFSLTGDFLKRNGADWDDVFLADRIKSPLKRAQKAINSAGATAPNRGLILMGPPGTGKTLSGRTLMNNAKATFIWISAKDFWRAGAMGGLSSGFEMARTLAPSILFIEDVDNWLGGQSVDLLKTEMDGVSQGSGVTTILTTNYPERLPDALIDRPGRFHDVLEVHLPEASERSAMFARWLPDVAGDALESIVKRTAGLSGAHIYELTRFAKTLQDEEELTIEKAVLLAIDKVEQQRAMIDQNQLSGSTYRPGKSDVDAWNKHLRSVGSGVVLEAKGDSYTAIGYSAKPSNDGTDPFKAATKEMVLNAAGVRMAAECIEKGDVSESDEWTPPTSESEDAYIDASGMDEYAKWFLGERSDAEEGTKMRCAYPFTSDFKTCDRAGLAAIQSRAGAEGETAIEAAAGQLLAAMDEMQGSDGSTDGDEDEPAKAADDKASDIDDVKAGRALSKANEKKLRDAADDLAEVVKMDDVSRAAKALVRAAVTSINGVLSSLGEAEDDPKLTTLDAVKLLIIDGNADVWRTAHRALDALLTAEANEYKAQAYERLVSGQAKR